MNPNDALVAIKIAQYYACVDRHDEAVTMTNRAILLNPGPLHGIGS